MQNGKVVTLDVGAVHRVHFIGIGGIGVSAVARMMLFEGKEVSGSDRSVSLVTEGLVRAGARVAIGHAGSNIPADADLVVYTNAMAPDNEEMVAARKRGAPMLSYPEMLGLVSRSKYTIAVAGSHGKTTTTAMIAHILRTVGRDPSVIVGSLLRTEKSNYIAGKSNYFVVEADEYKRAFLNLSPKLLVITNLDLDHLDYYKDLADIQSAFRALAEKVSVDSFVITDLGNDNLKPIADGLACKIIDYATVDLGDLKLAVPGEHNRSNARAAVAAARALGVDETQALTALATFESTWRRFEYKGMTPSGALVYDDYAHNPQKVRAALQGAKEAHPDKKIVAVFQPHLYSRTKTLFGDFAQSFADADTAILLPIYAAREAFDPSITSEMLAQAIGEKAISAASFDGARVLLKKYDNSETLVLVMGAGDITDLAASLVEVEN